MGCLNIVIKTIYNSIDIILYRNNIEYKRYPQLYPLFHNLFTSYPQ